MKKIGIIGLGNMGGAIAEKLAESKEFILLGFDPDPKATLHFSSKLTLQNTAREVATQADYLLLAVKPQILGPLLTDLTPSLSPQVCLLSIAAGVSLEKLIHWSEKTHPVVRIMPNTPILCGQGVCAICLDHHLLKKDHKNEVQKIFSAVGTTYVLPEGLFDAFTGLIGSGPAYVFAFMEALINAGVTLGLPRPQATEMVSMLLQGSVSMLQSQNGHPTLLKEQVTSPGGTTIAALNRLDEHRFSFAISQAVQASAKRAREMGTL